MIMKKVKFITIKSELCDWDPFKGKKYIFTGINETIEKMINDGWEYCGFVPNETRGIGDIEKLSLVFQREEQ